MAIDRATQGDDFIRGSGQIVTYLSQTPDGQPLRPNDETGDDRVYVRGGDSRVFLGGGEDTAYGGDGNDLMFGNAGSDRLFGEAGDDVIVGQEDDDTVIGGDGQDSVFGGTLDDVLLGNAGNDTIYGGAEVGFETDPDFADISGGRDKLYGGAGNDYLFGGNDNDILVGGAGRDWLRGGQGADRFLFDDLFGDDRIADFQPGRDIVDLTRIGITAVDVSYSIVDALNDGSADDLLVTVAGHGSIALIRTEQSDLTATNFVI